MSEREFDLPASVPTVGCWQQATVLSVCFLVGLVGVLAAVLGVSARFLAGVVVAFGLQTLALASAERATPRTARLLTLPTVLTVLRGSAAVALAGFLLVPPPDGLAAWAPAMLYGGAALLDAVDGSLARATGTTSAYGSRADVETDALAVLLAAAVAVHVGRAPAVFVLVGLARYGFVAAVWIRRIRRAPVRELPHRSGRRMLATTTMAATVVVLSPTPSAAVSHLVAVCTTAVLLAGFVRDWLLVTERL